VTGDPELDAMSAVSGALSSLDSDVQGRVLRWAAERFGIRQAPSNGGQGLDAGVGADRATSDGGVNDGSREFEHFAELFSAVGATSDADKALVAAYWVQVVQGQDAWQSRTVNADLKNSGHAVGNITKALQRNIDKKPQLVIQLKKSGNSRQATKTYKLTTEGITNVEGMLNAGSQ
jgi:hypothetical protein